MSAADGLACAAPSGFVTRIDRNLVSGDFTVRDAVLFDYLRMLLDTEDVFIEPSSCAAFSGPIELMKSAAGQDYLQQHGLTGQKLAQAVQICWATGGSLVPEEIREEYVRTHLED